MVGEYKQIDYRLRDVMRHQFPKIRVFNLYINSLGNSFFLFFDIYISSRVDSLQYLSHQSLQHNTATPLSVQ